MKVFIFTAFLQHKRAVPSTDHAVQVPRAPSVLGSLLILSVHRRQSRAYRAAPAAAIGKIFPLPVIARAKDEIIWPLRPILLGTRSAQPCEPVLLD
jgi:hypothetical protein